MFAERGCGHGCLRCEWESEGARELMERAQGLCFEARVRVAPGVFIERVWVRGGGTTRVRGASGGAGGARPGARARVAARRWGLAWV